MRNNLISILILMAATIVNYILWMSVDGFLNVYTVIMLILIYLVIERLKQIKRKDKNKKQRGEKCGKKTY